MLKKYRRTSTRSSRKQNNSNRNDCYINQLDLICEKLTRPNNEVERKTEQLESIKRDDQHFFRFKSSIFYNGQEFFGVAISKNRERARNLSSKHVLSILINFLRTENPYLKAKDYGLTEDDLQNAKRQTDFENSKNANSSNHQNNGRRQKRQNSLTKSKNNKYKNKENHNCQFNSTLNDKSESFSSSENDQQNQDKHKLNQQETNRQRNQDLDESFGLDNLNPYLKCKKINSIVNNNSSIKAEIDQIAKLDKFTKSDQPKYIVKNFSSSSEDSDEPLINLNSTREAFDFIDSNLINKKKSSKESKLSNNEYDERSSKSEELNATSKNDKSASLSVPSNLINSQNNKSPSTPDKIGDETTRRAIDYLESNFEIIRSIFKMHDEFKQKRQLIEYPKLIRRLEKKLPKLEIVYRKNKLKEKGVLAGFSKLYFEDQCLFTVFDSLDLDNLDIDLKILERLDRKLYFTIYLQFAKRMN